MKSRKAANQMDKGQQNTIKPNPLSSPTFLKRHRLTLFHYYHLCQKIKIFTSIITQKKKKKKENSHQVINILHSSRSLKTKKKGESLYSNCVSPFGCRETLVSIFLIYCNFGFCIEFCNEVKSKEWKMFVNSERETERKIEMEFSNRWIKLYLYTILIYIQPWT